MYSFREGVVLNPLYQGAKITGISGAAAYNSDAIDMGKYTEAIAFINMTAQSGTTPTLDCKVQYSPDYDPTTGIGTWVDSGDSFTQITTTTGLFLKKLSSNFGKYIRLVFTLGGTTPNYTFKPYLVAKG